jgi:hypothetical protein
MMLHGAGEDSSSLGVVAVFDSGACFGAGVEEAAPGFPLATPSGGVEGCPPL